MAYQGYPSYQGSKFNAATSICDPIFMTTFLRLKIFYDYPFATENFS